MAVKDDFLPTLLTVHGLLAGDEDRPEVAVAATVSLFGLRVLAMAPDLVSALGIDEGIASYIWDGLLRGRYSLTDAIEELSGDIDMPALFHEPVLESVSDDVVKSAVFNLDELDAPIRSPEDLKRVNRAVDRFIGEMARFKEVAALSTPQTFNKLIAELLLAPRESDVSSVYDPACGMGGSLVAVHDVLAERRQATETHFLGADSNPNVVTVAAWRLLLRGVTTFAFEVHDVLSEPDFFGRRDERRFDIVASVPPFYPTVNADAGTRKTLRGSRPVRASGRRADFVFVQHVMFSVADGGRGAVAIALSALNRSGHDEAVRRRLAHNYTIETVMSLHDGAVPRLSAAPALVLFDSGKSYPTRDAIFFLAARENRSAPSRPQPLDDETVERILVAYKRHRNQVGTSAIADLGTIKAQHYSLVPHLYITPEAIEVQEGRTLEVRVRLLEKEFTETGKALDKALGQVKIAE